MRGNVVDGPRAWAGKSDGGGVGPGPGDVGVAVCVNSIGRPEAVRETAGRWVSSWPVWIGAGAGRGKGY